MKNYLIYYLFITLSIFLYSCSEGFKDEAIKYFDDSASTGWQLIARQVDSDVQLFSSNASNTFLENENDNSSSTFMSIGNLTRSNYADTDGKYKFKLEWDGKTVASSGINKEITWTQTSWLTDTTVQGLQEIGTSDYVDGTASGFDGLMKTNWTSHCVIDGNQEGNGWFHCVGLIGRWNGGIPGPKGLVASSMALYIWTP